MKRKKIDLSAVLQQAQENSLPIATCATDFCENSWRISLVQGDPKFVVLEKHFRKNLNRPSGWDWLILDSGPLDRVIERAKWLPFLVEK